MLGTDATRRAGELRAMLDSGKLRGLGPIDTEGAAFLSVEAAVLADLAHLTELTRFAQMRPDRWGALEHDIDVLYRAITEAHGEDR